MPTDNDIAIEVRRKRCMQYLIERSIDRFHVEQSEAFRLRNALIESQAYRRHIKRVERIRNRYGNR